MLSPLEQSLRAITEAKDILVITPGDGKGDSIASISALYAMLLKLQKNVTAVAVQGIPSNLRFLPRTSEIHTQLHHAHDFIISLDISRTPVDQLSYKVEGNRLNINITPKNRGKFEEKDVAVRSGKPKFDLIITINTPDLESLGSFFEDNTEIFYESTVLNIDHQAANEAYGKINAVDLQAAATTELIYELAKKLSSDSKQLLDEPIATALLTGIIAETESFQTYATTPRVLKIASELYEMGAKQQEIIRFLFKTKSLSALNLWGRVLARLKQNAEAKLTWSILSEEDFRKSGADKSDIDSVLKELLSTVPGTEVVLVIYEETGKFFGKIHAPHNVDAMKIAAHFEKPEGNSEMAHFAIGAGNLTEAETKVIDEIKKEHLS